MVDKISSQQHVIPTRMNGARTEDSRTAHLSELAVSSKGNEQLSEINGYLRTDDKEQIEELVKGLNEFLTPVHTSLKFEFHEKLNEYYVAVINDNTKEVIKEIPPKKLLDLYAAMAEMMGIIVDKKI